MMFDIERSIKDSLADISKELGIQMRYRSEMPDGQTAHYVQYRPDETVAWTSSGMRDYKTAKALLEEIHCWGRVLSCKRRVVNLRIDAMEDKFRKDIGIK